MSQHEADGRNEEGQAVWSSPSEPEIHTEHQAALDATLFRSASDPYELVLELDAGQLRLRETDPEPT
jgi:hypothetical protein